MHLEFKMTFLPVVQVSIQNAIHFLIQKKNVSTVKSHNQLVEVYTENIFSKHSRVQSFRKKV